MQVFTSQAQKNSSDPDRPGLHESVVRVKTEIASHPE